ncbi:MAG: hypothetical protein P8J52_10435 [Gammaproteobacteria bacterium]|nr:hypothetical protein [Gammaproteobacteria bacterium]MDG2118717.1 hypothetical protein [Gammaproteobacteria bacterium]
MRNFYKSVAAMVLVTILTVLYVPGADDYVELTFQQYLGRAAR